MAGESEVSTNIRAALAQHLKRDVAQVRLDDELRKDLGLDSLSMIELLFRIEEAFDIEIPNEDLGEIRTVGDVTAYVERRIATKGAPSTAPARPAAPPPAPAVARPATPPPAASPRPATAERTAPKRATSAAKVGSAKAAAAKTATARATASAKAAAKKKGSRRT